MQNYIIAFCLSFGVNLLVIFVTMFNSIKNQIERIQYLKACRKEVSWKAYLDLFQIQGSLFLTAVTLASHYVLKWVGL